MDIRSIGRLNVLSLCSGAGGLDLGLRVAVPAARTVVYVEVEAFNCALLVKAIKAGVLDDAPLWSDLRTFDGRPWRGKVDCLIAGFPCQPHSLAGARKGTGDQRWIWPDLARIIRESGCWLVFLENVPALVDSGLEDVQRDLAQAGFDAEWDLFSASEVGASHKRERLFIVAYSKHRARRDQRRVEPQQESRRRAEAANEPVPGRQSEGLADTGRKSRPGVQPTIPKRGQSNRATVKAGSATVAISKGRGRGELRNTPKPRLVRQSDGLDKAMGDSERTRREARDGHQLEPAREPTDRRAELADTRSQGPSDAEPVELRGAQRLDQGRAVEQLRGTSLGRCRAFLSCERPATRMLRSGQLGHKGKSLSVCGPCWDSRAKQYERKMGESARDDKRKHRNRRPRRKGQDRRSGRAVAEPQNRQRQVHERQGKEGARAFDVRGLGIFAPGPVDPRWEGIIANAPYLAPAVEPGFRVLVDGLAYVVDEYGLDQLRTCGNGVVPLCAAYAFAVLVERL